ncbi:pilus assembly protein TadG-related protein [Caulobacter sp. ErkDOM-YI]|uniref:pilus assembly protein TadG-related protein n=1 Tax=unclassified Caulobacter TaxID=2648921 RepID=UPI003AF7D340
MLHFRKRASAGLFKHLRGDERGAVAVQFAFLALPISILAFGLLDMNRISVQRRQLQDALDAATLMAARSTATTDAGLDTVGDAAFAAEMAGLGLTLTAANTTFTSGTGNKVIGAASVTVTPIISNLWTNGNSTVTASSEVQRSVNKLEVALVLDNTGSMDYDLGSGGKKIDALIDASKSLVDVLSGAAARASDTDAVKIAVVPFSMTVNVGSTFQNANWITGTLPTAYGDDIFDTNTERFALFNKMKLSWTGCIESRPDPYDIADTAPTNSNKATMFVPFFAPDEPDANAVPSGSSWRGTTYYTSSNNYITDDETTSNSWFVRQGNVQKYDTSHLTGSADDDDGGPNKGCGITDVMRLTNVRSSTNANLVKAKLDKMVATGNTNVAMGAMWGWHAVSPNAPFADGQAYGTKNVSKIMVLLTDGDNVMSESSNPNDSTYSGYGYVWQKRLKNSSNVALDAGSSSTQRRDAMDSRQSKVCANAKAKGVIIYSIGVGVSSHSRSVLEACATSTDKYYDVTDAAQLTEVFNTIAGSIQNLRISK